jgi:hypothetical protein
LGMLVAGLGGGGGMGGGMVVVVCFGRGVAHCEGNNVGCIDGWYSWVCGA